MAKKGVSKKKAASVSGEPQSVRTSSPVKMVQVPQPPVRLAAETIPASLVAKPAAIPAPALKQPVQFALIRPGAQRITVAGEFNGWSADTTSLVKRTGDSWAITIELKPGRYQYKFVVDGEWLTDPAAVENVSNVHGTLNSVMEVRS
jgi:1,4-alpha-glucan branching enzyme